MGKGNIGRDPDLRGSLAQLVGESDGTLVGADVGDTLGVLVYPMAALHPLFSAQSAHEPSDRLST